MQTDTQAPPKPWPPLAPHTAEGLCSGSSAPGAPREDPAGLSHNCQGKQSHSAPTSSELPPHLQKRPQVAYKKLAAFMEPSRREFPESPAQPSGMADLTVDHMAPHGPPPERARRAAPSPPTPTQRWFLSRPAGLSACGSPSARRRDLDGTKVWGKEGLAHTGRRWHACSRGPSRRVAVTSRSRPAQLQH